MGVGGRVPPVRGPGFPGKPGGPGPGGHALVVFELVPQPDLVREVDAPRRDFWLLVLGPAGIGKPVEVLARLEDCGHGPLVDERRGDAVVDGNGLAAVDKPQQRVDIVARVRGLALGRGLEEVLEGLERESVRHAQHAHVQEAFWEKRVFQFIVGRQLQGHSLRRLPRRLGISAEDKRVDLGAEDFLNHPHTREPVLAEQFRKARERQPQLGFCRAAGREIMLRCGPDLVQGSLEKRSGQLARRGDRVQLSVGRRGQACERVVVEHVELLERLGGGTLQEAHGGVHVRVRRLAQPGDDDCGAAVDVPHLADLLALLVVVVLVDADRVDPEDARRRSRTRAW